MNGRASRKGRAVSVFGEEKEFTFRRQEFDKIRELLYQKTGIRLADSKDSMVYSRLARRLRALKLKTFSEYLGYLHSHPSEEQSFIDSLTTNLTSFFREKHHFPLLKDYIHRHPGPLKIWCSASSTGEEPYSIAMTVVEAYGCFNPPVEIIASDIDTTVLQKAKQGVYSLDNVKNLSVEQKKRFFHKGVGANQGKVRVVPELAKMVTFQQINLTHNKWALKGPIDVIFCRNVMIYFDKPTQLEILTRMVRLMPKTGIYIAGHSETFAGAGHLVTPLGNTIYQPVGGGR
ncbi:CheR family methyltransferase [Paraglaciecola sp.]|uniref:CheR family methyltransferase n=1 Tax=Paraglaciecola sp. TaxID=1920173 RepID=UPI003EF0AD90